LLQVGIAFCRLAERAVRNVKAASGGLHQDYGGHMGVLTGLPGLETVREQLEKVIAVIAAEQARRCPRSPRCGRE
jgi:hypothetical protein